jgi:hypothetical protein
MYKHGLPLYNKSCNDRKTNYNLYIATKNRYTEENLTVKTTRQGED